MKRSLFLKILAGFVIVIVTMTGLTLLLSYRTIRNHHVETQREGLRLLAMGLKPTFSAALAENDPARLDSLAKDLGLHTSSRITIVDPRGSVVADSWRDPLEMDNHRTRPEIMRALRGEVGASLRYSATLREDLLYVAVPVGDMGRVDAVLRVSLRLESIDEALSGLRDDILLIGVLVAVLSLIGALFFSRSISRPIAQLTAASRKVAAGDFDARVLLKGGGELKELADSFNYMTDRVKDLFEELSGKSEELNGVVGTIQDGLLVLDKDGRIVLSNPGFLRIVGDEDVNGKFYWEVTQVPELDELVRVTTARRASSVREVPFAGRTYLCSGDFLSSREGVVLLIHDITDMKNMEKIKKDFVVNLSHELRTPLTAIKGFLETLEDEVTVDGRHYLGIVRRHTDRLADIVEDLLVLSELEDSCTELEIGKVDLVRLIEDVIHVFEPGAREKGLGLKLEAGGGGTTVSGDHFKLEQVFINLIDNAVKYTERGEVLIRIATDDANIRVAVEDTGAGIPEEHLSRIFERFYVVDKSRSKKVGGTGLGLSIVKHIILLHGGTVEVDSEPGKGTRFTVTIPTAQHS